VNAQNIVFIFLKRTQHAVSSYSSIVIAASEQIELRMYKNPVPVYQRIEKEG
jgi:hypothetical protein